MEKLLKEFELEFVQFREGSKNLIVRKHYQDILSKTLLNLETIEPVPLETGRAAIYSFNFNESKGIIRKYKRGGIIKYILKDYFILINRPMKELQVLDYLFVHGFPSPEPLGILWERHAIFLSGYIATRWLPGNNILTQIKNYGIESLKDSLWINLGILLRKLHDLDVFHGDLHLGNILFNNDQVYLVDFDKARICKKMGKIKRKTNLARLYRSLKKHKVPENYFEKILEGYHW